MPGRVFFSTCLRVSNSLIMTSDDFADEEDFTDVLPGERLTQAV